MKYTSGKIIAVSALALSMSIAVPSLTNAQQETQSNNGNRPLMDASEVHIRPDCSDINLSACISSKDITPTEFNQMVQTMKTAREAAIEQSLINIIETGGFGLTNAITGGNTARQTVWLNFNNPNDTFGVAIVRGRGDNQRTIRIDQYDAHVFTTAERNAIQNNIEEEYSDFNFNFTQTRPRSGQFSTLNFFCDFPEPCIDYDDSNGGIPSILFGRAQGIDVLNNTRNDSAFVDPNFWEFVVQELGIPQFAAFTGLPANNANITQQLSVAVVNQASNTGAHELGHNQGLRHHDSFGAIGDGLPTTGQPAPNDFTPPYRGPVNAAEGSSHTMASGASAGITLADSANRNRFFGERSIRKLALNQTNNITVSEASIRGSDNNENITLSVLNDFNATVPAGVNANRDLRIEQIVINGEISRRGQRDQYRFSGRAGDIVSVEVNSFDITVGADSVMTTVDLFRVTPSGRLRRVARNEQGFEGFDPYMVDVRLPRNADYVVRVFSPNIIQVDDADFNLTNTGNVDLRTGEYQANIYKITAR